jgi:hypothetical protein
VDVRESVADVLHTGSQEALFSKRPSFRGTLTRPKAKVKRLLVTRKWFVNYLVSGKAEQISEEDLKNAIIPNWPQKKKEEELKSAFQFRVIPRTVPRKILEDLENQCTKIQRLIALFPNNQWLTADTADNLTVDNNAGLY